MHRIVPVTLLVMLGVSALLAQQNTGRIAGSVVDATGAAIPTASVQLSLAGGGVAASTTTRTDGLFNFSAIQPGTYDLTVESAGFAKQIIRGMKVDPGREASIPAITMEVAGKAEVVEVTATNQGVQTSNTEVSTTITTNQIRNLPLLNRSPLALIATQAGVTYNGRTNTVINGQRPSFSNVTVDGVNVQDNFIRTNALDFLPNLLLLDQVAEVTVVSSNSSAAVGGGSSQVIISTPTGTNTFHGSVYWANRNRTFAANTWFNNRDGIARPPYNQNQGGGAIGGPIIKDKLFFYANYEAFRLAQQSSYNTTILTDDARNGIYTYKDTGGTVHKVNVLTAMGVSANSTMAALIAKVPAASKINNYRVGDSSESFLRNTAGYSFPLRYDRFRDNVTGKVDYIRSTKNVFSGTFAWNRDYLDRYDLTVNYDAIPPVFNNEKTKFVSATWRWSPTPTFTNELRGGFNLAPALFLTSYDHGQYNVSIAGTQFNNPTNFYTGAALPQGRFTNTFSLQDNASYVRGLHNFQFGYQMQKIRVKSFSDPIDIVPWYTLGMGIGNLNGGLTTTQMPGIGSTDLGAANSLLANLGGYITQASQTYNVTTRTSGFVNGANYTRNFTLNNYAGYFQDNWKVARRLTLNLGLRYDYYSPVDERNALVLLPVSSGQSAIDTLMSNSTLDFAGNAVGRSWYNADHNNFGPVVGFAWDVFGTGKTAIRAAYSLSYVNDEDIRAADNNTATNSGLQLQAVKTGLTANLTSPPAVTAPTYKVPRQFADNYALNTQTAYGMPDPTLRTPYVQQWTFGIQQAVKGAVIEARYVGIHSSKLWRAIDYNQVDITSNGFLADFKNAYSNGILALAATGSFRPAYNAAIAGSVPLPVFAKVGSSGYLTNSSVINYILQQQVGELANFYQINGVNGSVNFYRNPYGLGCNMITNYSNGSYDALQIDVRKQTRSGLYLQGNYTWGKNLSDQDGTQQTRFEPFLDINNAKIERAPTSFDLRQQIKINASYELPMGKGHKLSYQPLNRVLGGWFVAGIYTWQTGNPFSVLSARGTLNRAGRSGSNTASSFLTAAQLDDLFQVRMTGNGPWYFASSALNPNDGRAVATDGSAAFSGQVFYQPGAGQLGSLQRRMFNGPRVWNLDFSAGKRIDITERHSIQIRMDAANFFNHTTWYVGDQTITSTTFGRITSTMFDRRLIQFGATYRF
ncbi:MAG: TonB-dependent receptor [Bryobacteraceae bacterium]